MGVLHRGWLRGVGALHRGEGGHWSARSQGVAQGDEKGGSYIPTACIPYLGAFASVLKSSCRTPPVCLSLQVMEAIGSVFEQVRFAAGELIIAAGDPMEHVYLIAQVCYCSHFFWRCCAHQSRGARGFLMYRLPHTSTLVWTCLSKPCGRTKSISSLSCQTRVHTLCVPTRPHHFAGRGRDLPRAQC